ncbi:DUF3221 domain-containing protein [Ectobacillus antri]|jgi:hypothetical protein|uniref:DUF3221 domain-containing protein n=1 Tax=Ectobacillus antri TaxID=2486280 RepID=A0ABT6H4D7_9BACI|nr:DUF3221 domain-containing protein [Ectobacillus antri]MDG4658076.1 DUF3221 domain-containing protein [Ectobacillus antri]MDG5753683.1 DUF3221 domain-containing protein [Ectobacillus antri]
MYKLLCTLLLLLGCTACTENEVKQESIIFQGIVEGVDETARTLLVQSDTHGTVRVVIPVQDEVKKYSPKQEVSVWITGELRESNPAQGKASRIEVLEGLMLPEESPSTKL